MPKITICSIRCGYLIFISVVFRNTRYKLEGYYPSYEYVCIYESRMKEGDSLIDIPHWSLTVDHDWDSDPKNIHRRKNEIKS